MSDRATPDLVIAAVRSMGSDARDLRDAAHEAYHAIRANVRPGSWTRDGIHRAILRRSKSALDRNYDLAAHEIGARAVEQIVCAHLGVPIEPVEVLAMNAVLEGAVSGVIAFPSQEWFAERVLAWMDRPNIIEMADRVSALRPRVSARRRQTA